MTKGQKPEGPPNMTFRDSGAYAPLMAGVALGLVLAVLLQSLVAFAVQIFYR